MALEKMIFKVFPMINLWEQKTIGHGQFGTQGHGWQDFCTRPLDIATYICTKYISCGPHGFREDFTKFSHYKSMETLDPWGGTSLDPRALIGRIYVRDH